VMRSAHLTSSTPAGRAGYSPRWGHPAPRIASPARGRGRRGEVTNDESWSRCCGIRALHQEAHNVDGDQCCATPSATSRNSLVRTNDVDSYETRPT